MFRGIKQLCFSFMFTFRGTTWTQEIVDLLLHNGDADACKRAPTPIRSPFLEICGPPPIPSGVELHSCLHKAPFNSK